MNNGVVQFDSVGGVKHRYGVGPLVPRLGPHFQLRGIGYPQCPKNPAGWRHIMSKDTWLKLHTSILTSRKFISLPHNDHRQAYFVLLLLAKKGLESAPESYLLGHLNLGKKRWNTVKGDLVAAGLLDPDGSVSGFEESQLSSEAWRKRKQRERDKQCDKSRDKSRDSHSDSRMQSAECRKEREKNALDNKATAKEADFAIRLLKKHGMSEEFFLKGKSAWTSEMVDRVVSQLRDAPVAVGPKVKDTFVEDPEIPQEDRDKSLEFLSRKGRGRQ